MTSLSETQKCSIRQNCIAHPALRTKSRNQANLHECSPKIFSISGRGKQLQCFFFEESREYASFVSRFVTPEVSLKKKSYTCTLSSIVYIQCTLASRYSIDDQ